MAKKTKEPIVSIIIPVYNIGAYLSRCLESLVSQTFSEFEILCVDDASTDDSVEIAKRFQTQDDRIRLVQQVHQGVSAARNLGITHAKGEYVVFVDGDDWVESDMLQKMLERAEETRSDIVVCSANVHFADLAGCSTRRKKSLQSALSSDDGVWSSDGSVEGAWSVVNRSGFWPFIWNKLIRRDLIQKNNILFSSELPLGEDGVFLHMLLQYAKTIAFMSEPFYNYVYQRKDSATVNHFQNISTRFGQHIRVAYVMSCEFLQRNLLEKNKKHLLVWFLNFLYSDFIRLSSRDRYENSESLRMLICEFGLSECESELTFIQKRRLKNILAIKNKYSGFERKFEIIRTAAENRIVRLLNLYI